MDKKTDIPAAPEITASYIQSQYPEVAKPLQMKPIIKAWQMATKQLKNPIIKVF